MKRFCLIGVKGIGKTTLINSILDKIPHIDYLIGSQVLRSLVGLEFDNFDSFPDGEKKRFREEAIAFMIKRQYEMKKDILVDGHTTLYNRDTNSPENVFTELDCKFFTDLILYETSAEKVLERRKKDLNKKRILELPIIKKELKYERLNSQRIAKSNGMQMHYLNNNSIVNIQIKLIEFLKGE